MVFTFINENGTSQANIYIAWYKPSSWVYLFDAIWFDGDSWFLFKVRRLLEKLHL